MKKISGKALCIILTFIFATSSFAVSGFAAGSENNIDATDGSSKKLKYDFVVSGGEISRVIYDEDGNVLKPTVDRKPTFGKSASLPSSYDSRSKGYVTPVKDQGNGGVCWAFGAISNVESNFIKKGYGKKTNTDFSEDHLVWFSSKKDSTLNDGVNTLYDNTDENGPYGYGGNWYLSSTTLINYWGAELEENAPYDSEDMDNNGHYSESERTASYAHLQSAECIAYSNEDCISRMKEIKTAIMNNGSVDASYYHNDYNLNNESYYYANKDQDEGIYANHEIAIIGWDDSISKYNFESMTGDIPSKNGAWLVKNSHGTDYYSDGYMWLSYYDEGIQTVVSLDVEKTSNYDHVRSYNGYNYVPGVVINYETENLSMEYANAFTTKNPETLKAVGIWTLQENVSYTIKVYRHLSKGADGYTTGTLVNSCTTSGTADYHGYHTIKLNNPVNLSADERYLVAVKISVDPSGDGFLLYPFEGSMQKLCEEYPDDGYEEFNFEYDSNAGESFLKVNGTFVDTKKVKDKTLNNAFINAYTSDTPTPSSYKVSFDAKGGSVSNSVESVAPGNSITLPTPTKNFKVTYDANGGSNAPSSQDFKVTCKGWSYNSSASTVAFKCGDSYKPTSDTEFYAVWDKTAQGNLSTNKPTRSGYEFLGWSQDKNAGKDATLISPGRLAEVNGDTTFYAVWKENGGGGTHFSFSISIPNLLFLPFRLVFFLLEIVTFPIWVWFA